MAEALEIDTKVVRQWLLDCTFLLKEFDSSQYVQEYGYGGVCERLSHCDKDVNMQFWHGSIKRRPICAIRLQLGCRSSGRQFYLQTNNIPK
jgi:hypothetical protein